MIFFKVFEGKPFFNIDGDRDIQNIESMGAGKKSRQSVTKNAKQVPRTNQIYSRLWIKIKTESHIWFLLIQTD
jgi:hypothetical protein